MAAKAAVPIIFCADAHYGAYIPVILQSVLEKASPARRYIICVFDCGLKAEDWAALKQQLAPYENFSFRHYPLTDYLEANKQAFAVAEGHHLTAASYGRLFIPQLCAEFDKIIYADIDMIFNADPAALADTDIGENYIAGAVDKNIEAERQSRAGIAKYCRETLGLRDDEAYINSGLLLFNGAAWREKGLVARCLAELKKRRFKRHDQDMINFICGGKIYYLDGSWNAARKLSGAGEDAAGAGEQEAGSARGGATGTRNNAAGSARGGATGSRGGAQAEAAGCAAAAGESCVYHFVGSLKPWHILPEDLPETDIACAGAEKWWAYARKTAIYPQLRQSAAACRAQFNQNLGRRRLRLLGLPIGTVQTAPRKKKYSLFGVPIGREVINSKTGARVFSLLGVKMRRG